MVKIAGSLEKRRQCWYAVLEVPPSLRVAAGTSKKRKTLETRDKHVAQARLPAALLGLHAWLDAIRRKRPETDPIIAEALGWRASLKAAEVGQGVPTAIIQDHHGYTHEVPDDGFLRDAIMERGEAIERDEGEDRAHVFADVAYGRATFTKQHVEEWLAEDGDRGPRRSRTSDDYRSIVLDFAQWSCTEGGGAIIERVSRRVCGLYAKELQGRGLSATRVRSRITALTGYWAWMERRGVRQQDAPNPWSGQAPRKPIKSADEATERAFTADEVKALFGGTKDRFLLDLMTIGALTGMRIEEIARLTVGMCQGDTISAPGVKGTRPVVPRDVPMHPDLASIITRLAAGKATKDYLLDGLKMNKNGERSPSASKRFNRYREKVKVHERPDGKRRSLVNFHSFRRWFITRGLEAGQPVWLIREVVGHKQPKEDQTTNRYTTMGQLQAAKRACVEAVRLPA